MSPGDVVEPPSMRRILKTKPAPVATVKALEEVVSPKAAHSGDLPATRNNPARRKTTTRDIGIRGLRRKALRGGRDAMLTRNRVQLFLGERRDAAMTNAGRKPHLLMIIRGG